MNSEIIIALMQNIAILLAMVFIYSLLLSNHQTKKLNYKIILGIFNGLVGILLMWSALRLDNGVIFDTRSILISVLGMFFGAIPTLIAASIMILYRISLGGPGMTVGIFVVLTTSILGILAHKYYLQQILDNLKNRGLKFYLFGVIVHIDMLLCMFILPEELRWETLLSIFLPVIILYPFGTYLLCKILLDQMDKTNLINRLAESEDKYRNLAENTSDLIWSLDLFLNFTYVSPASLKIFEEPPEVFIKKSIIDRIIPLDQEKVRVFFNDILSRTKDAESEINDPRIIECRYKKNTGNIIWISISANGVRDQQGKLTGIIGTIRDIDRLKKIEIENNSQGALIVSIIDSIPDLIFYKDVEGRYMGCNEAFAEFCGRPKSEILGKTDHELFNQAEADWFRQMDIKMVAEKTQRQDEELVTYPDGSKRMLDTLKTPYWSFDGIVDGIIGVSRDITERKQKDEEIQYVAFHDYLTGLYNRRFYEEELHRLDVPRNLPLTVVMGDVNGLKLVNDSFGHNFGDILLQKVAELLKLHCRNDDIIARFGGDEFVVLLPKTNAEAAEIILERIHDSLSRENINGVALSVSFGRQTKTNVGEAIENITKGAEDNMYRNKFLVGASVRSKTIDIIMNTLYEKNNREMLHSKRVSQICEKIAIQMNLEKSSIEQLKVAGLFHDIGKIGIDENILNSPDQLTEAQWIEMKKHSEIGYRILSGSDELSDIARFVLEHQEKWDGSGYPNGIAGDSISLEARIIAIADAFDAMTRPRTYGNMFTVEQALEEIKKGAGTHFDPMLAGMFVENYWKMFE
ncbi:MAG: diguanylate cyclase [Firmicutes bacterium]|nr:diguanylate cyclase [Bacillota bacterium]